MDFERSRAESSFVMKRNSTFVEGMDLNRSTFENKMAVESEN